MRVACVVSHMDELTVTAAVQTIAKSGGGSFSLNRVVAGKTPMSASFNAALDIALDADCDVLVHTASDVLLQRHAIAVLLNTLDLNTHYLAVARGYDSIHGFGTGGLWAFNMHVIGNRFRFRDVFKQDLDLCTRVEAETGLVRSYTPKNDPLTYHHPIWTARELYGKFRYSYPKYEKESARESMTAFLREGLKLNPSNKALLAGRMGLEAAQRSGAVPGAKDQHQIDLEFARDCSGLETTGKEFYVKHGYYLKFAQGLLDSDETCIPGEDEPGVPFVMP